MISRENKLVICALGSVHEKFDVETKSLHIRNSHVGHSILIHGSTQTRHVGFYLFKRRSLHVLNSPVSN